jgi:hypothetical protein
MPYLNEPALDEVLADPIVHLVMRRDGIGPGEVRAAIERARAILARRALSARLANPGYRIRPTRT